MTVVKVDITSWDGVETVDEIEYRVSYLVTTNDRNDGPRIVKQALPIALDMPYLSGNDSDPNTILNGVTVTQASEGDFFHWVVDATYKSTERRTNPLIEPVQENIAWNGVQREVFFFANGLPILNTARQILDDPVPVIDNLPVLTYVVNQASFPFSLAALVRNSTNNATWKGMAAATVKVQSMSTERIADGKFGIYYKVTYVFEHNPEGYQLNTPSMGRHQLMWFEFKAAEPPKNGNRGTPARPAGWYPIPIVIGNVVTDRPRGLDVNGFYTSGIAPDNPIATITGDLYIPMNYTTLFPFLL